MAFLAATAAERWRRTGRLAASSSRSPTCEPNVSLISTCRSVGLQGVLLGGTSARKVYC